MDDLSNKDNIDLQNTQPDAIPAEPVETQDFIPEETAEVQEPAQDISPEETVEVQDTLQPVTSEEVVATQVDAQPVEVEQPVVPGQPQEPVSVNAGYIPNTTAQGAYQNTNTAYSYQPQYGAYSPMTSEQIENNRKSNKKGRKAFFAVLAVIVIITAVALPVSLLKNKGKSDISGSDSPAINENAPSFSINETPAANSSSQSKGVLTAEQVYEKIAKSNVAIIVYRNNAIYTEGTGIVMMEDAKANCTYILTCAHVISDSNTEIVIQLEDGERYDAQVVGYDARTDIGVLRVQKTGFTVAEFGDSDALKVGSTVYAIGNPGGSALFGTFTDGKVSAIGRNITSSIGYDMVCIQHNAAISPGNSGGALVNEYGQVIGINSSKIAATEFEGISFSIPITQAKDVIDKVIAHGYVPGRAKLGISYVANDSSSINSMYGMAVQMMNLPSGSLVIYSIDSNSSLANTEVQPGDMITAVNGKDLDTADVLLEVIEKSSVGDELELSLFRIERSGGRYVTSDFKVKVKLIEEKNTGKEETTTHGVYGSDDYGYGFDFDFGF